VFRSKLIAVGLRRGRAYRIPLPGRRSNCRQQDGSADGAGAKPQGRPFGRKILGHRSRAPRAFIWTIPTPPRNSNAY
jgi:hypothetical protein